jgi:hypothetical protein
MLTGCSRTSTPAARGSVSWPRAEMTQQSMSELVAGLEARGTCIGMHFRFYKAQASRGKEVSFQRWMARGQDCMTVGTVAVQWPRWTAPGPQARGSPPRGLAGRALALGRTTAMGPPGQPPTTPSIDVDFLALSARQNQPHVKP